MRPAQPGEGVQQDDDVLTGLDQPLGPLDHEFGERDVLPGAAVEGRGVHLPPDRPPHVGDLLGALVEQHHHQAGLGVVPGDRGGDLLKQDGLAGLRRGHDQPALPLAHRCEQVDEAPGRSGRRVFEAEPRVRVQRGQLAEATPGALPVERAAAHPDDAGEGAAVSAHALDQVALAQAVAADQRGGDGGVGRLGLEVLAPQVAPPARVDVEDTAHGLGRGPAYEGVFECGGHGGRSFRGHGHGTCGRRGERPYEGSHDTPATAGTAPRRRQGCPCSRGRAGKSTRRSAGRAGRRTEGRTAPAPGKKGRT